MINTQMIQIVVGVELICNRYKIKIIINLFIEIIDLLILQLYESNY